MMDLNKILVLCPYEFPFGLAAATRILAYSKGLVENGVAVEVLCFFPKIRDDKNETEGVIEGVKWKYVQEKNYNASKIWSLIIERPRVLLKTISHVYKSHKESKIDLVIMSFDNPYLQLFFVWLCRLKGIKVAFIGDEYPKQIRDMRDRVPSWDFRVFRLSHRFLACRILMTQHLIDFYNENVCNIPSFLLGSILDEDRFTIVSEIQNQGPDYLCYMGNKSPTKDDIRNIIEAFSIIKNSFPGLLFFIYGPLIECVDSVLIDQIKRLDLEERVIIKGKVDYYDVPTVLKNAKVLVTSQPVSKRAEGGFPTKMGEYMMCKRPMIITDVGEISRYVKDGETAFIVPPCNPAAYAEKLDYILTHPIESNIVALKAYQLAIDSFGCKNVTERLKKFLLSL